MKNYTKKTNRQLRAIYHNNSPLDPTNKVEGRKEEAQLRHKSAWAEIQRRGA